MAWICALALVGAAMPAQARAQQDGRNSDPLSTLPTVDRDRTDRTLPQLPRAREAAPSLPGSTTAVAAQPVVITLKAVRYEGASLPGPYLARATASFIGKPLTPDTLKALADAVGAAYAGSDIAYYSVMIPPQTAAGGVLTIRVTEGAVTQYTLNGVADGQATPRMAAQIRRIMRETPLRKSVLERAISLMRDLPGQSVEARIRQIDSQGALAIDLTEHRKVANVTVTIDNNGVANVINSFQAQVTVSGYNLLRDGDQTRVSSYLPIHPDRYQYYSISHSTPIGEDGVSLTLNGAHIRTRTFDRTIIGRATLAGASLSYPIIRSSKTNLVATAAIDGIDSSNYFLDTRFGDYRSRAVRLGASWSKSNEKNGYAASLVVSQGLAALGARAFVGFSERRFTKINLQAVAVRTVAKNVTVKVTSRAQFSRDKLPVTERMAVGGPGAGRAFRSGDITAEKAVSGVVELNWALAASKGPLKSASLFVFADGAIAGTVARPYYGLAAQDYSLASVGGGARINLTRTLRASVELAVPVKRPAPAYPRKVRLFVGIGQAF